MSHRAQLWIVGAAGIAFGLAVSALLLASNFDRDHGRDVAATLVIGWSYLGIGLSAWRSRPANRVGPLMIAIGFAWMASMLMFSDVPLVFSLGVPVSALPFVLVLHLLLAYPTGRLPGAQAQRVVALAYADLIVAGTLISLLTRHPGDVAHQGRNLFVVVHAPDVATAIQRGGTLIGCLLIAAGAALLVRRWVSATKLQRRALAPVLWTGSLLGLFLTITLLSDQLDGPESLTDLGSVLALVGMFCLPYAYMAGLAGFGLSRGRALGALVHYHNRPDDRRTLRDAMAQALGDPQLEIVFKRHDRDAWVDAAGRPFELSSGRTLTEIAREGETIGGLVHSSALGEDPELLRTVGHAAAIALDNDRLEAELRARVAELHESRANILAFGLAERRRLERDLHDGAQQRLVALSLQLSLARIKLEEDPQAAAALLDGARDELRQALDELRELARGIHPAVLTDQGLAAAVELLAERSPVPVTVERLPDQRLPSQVETVAYFVVSEALTNVAKYSHAQRAVVRVQRDRSHALVEVSDDGIGGADAERGTGLRGLADRVAALDGTLQIQSPAGAGTLVRAEIPCASS